MSTSLLPRRLKSTPQPTPRPTPQQPTSQPTSQPPPSTSDAIAQPVPAESKAPLRLDPAPQEPDVDMPQVDSAQPDADVIIIDSEQPSRVDASGGSTHTMSASEMAQLYSLKELKAMANERGVACNGKKQEICERLMALGSHQAGSEE